MAQNMSDFWRRWHISLSSWFRDYVYIPLGGSRKGEGRAYLNLMVTMLLSGLLHGAGWTFIVWGFLHEVAECMDRMFQKIKIKIPEIIKMLGTFIIVTFLWVIFRAENLGKGMFIWKAMVTVHSGINQPYTWTFFAVICLAAEMAGVQINKEKKGKIQGFYPILDLNKITALVVFFIFVGLYDWVFWQYGIYGKFKKFFFDKALMFVNFCKKVN